MDWNFLFEAILQKLLLKISLENDCMLIKKEIKYVDKYNYLIITLHYGIDVKVWFYMENSIQSAQSALHFTPWQTCSFRHQLNLTRKRLAMLQYCANTIQYYLKYSYHCLQPDTQLYSGVNWGIMERAQMPKLRNSSEGDSNPGSLDRESDNQTLYRWATSLHRWQQLTRILNNKFSRSSSS